MYPLPRQPMHHRKGTYGRLYTVGGRLARRSLPTWEPLPRRLFFDSTMPYGPPIAVHVNLRRGCSYARVVGRAVRSTKLTLKPRAANATWSGIGFERCLELSTCNRGEYVSCLRRGWGCAHAHETGE